MDYLPLPQSDEQDNAPLLDPESYDFLSGLNINDATKRSVSTCYKIVILLGISFIAFGGLFVYDSVSALKGDLVRDLDLTKTLYGIFFSIYALPNIFLVIGSGVLIDRIGNRKSGKIFASLIFIGAAICAGAPTLKRLVDLDPFVTYILMLVGRFIFGIGAESAYVVQNSMCVEWFQGKYLAKAMGVTKTVAHLGSVFSFNVEEEIASGTGDYIWALWFAAFTALISLGAVVIYSVIDKRAKKRMEPYIDDSIEEPRKITLNDIRHFSRRYWICVVIALFAENAAYAFRSLASGYMTEKWDYDQETANFLVSIVDITAMIGSPLLGFLVDLTGYNGWAVLLGNLIGTVGFVLMGLTSLHPVVGTVCVGLQYSFINAALFPSVSDVIEKNFEGTAYSIISAFINLSGTGIFPLAGWIADNYDFTYLCLFFASLALIASILSVVWNVLDMTNRNPVLNKKKE